MFMQNVVIWNWYEQIGACLLLLETQAPGRGCSEWLETPYSAPQPLKKTKKDLTPDTQKIF